MGSWNKGTSGLDRHTVSFGGNFNFVDTTESFPLFYPFEADFPSLGAYLGNDGPAGGVGAQGAFAASDPPGPGAAGRHHPERDFFPVILAPQFHRLKPTPSAVFRP